MDVSKIDLGRGEGSGRIKAHNLQKHTRGIGKHIIECMK